METLTDLAALSPSALTERLYTLRREERRLLVEFLHYLGEVDRREVHLAAGFASLFTFLTDHLGFTHSSAFRRSTAARLLREQPLVGEYLADGRLCLTTLVELRTVLAGCESPRQLLDRAAGKTEEEVKVLVAALAPRPVPADLVRKLPAPAPLSLSLPSAASAGPALIRRPDPPRVQPVTEDRHVVRLTVGPDLVAELERVKAALSHQIPDGNLEKVFAECMKLTLAAWEKRRRGAGRKTSKRPGPKSPLGRYLAVAVRDEVWRRDDSRCAFVGPDGRRCNATHQLEVHHRDPFARGGPPTVENLALFCKAHNLHAARRDFGAEHIERMAASRYRGNLPQPSGTPSLEQKAGKYETP
jgi:hypothetical protein